MAISSDLNRFFEDILKRAESIGAQNRSERLAKEQFTQEARGREIGIQEAQTDVQKRRVLLSEQMEPQELAQRREQMGIENLYRQGTLATDAQKLILEGKKFEEQQRQFDIETPYREMGATAAAVKAQVDENRLAMQAQQYQDWIMKRNQPSSQPNIQQPEQITPTVAPAIVTSAVQDWRKKLNKTLISR